MGGDRQYSRAELINQGSISLLIPSENNQTIHKLICTNEADISERYLTIFINIFDSSSLNPDHELTINQLFCANNFIAQPESFNQDSIKIKWLIIEFLCCCFSCKDQLT